MPKRIPTQHEYQRFHRATDRRVRNMFHKWGNGAMETEALREKFTTLLGDRHAFAGYLGRRRGGDGDPYDDHDTRFGQLAAESQEPYLDAFFADLEGGRYVDPATGLVNMGRIYDRAGMYVDRMRGSANEAFAGALDPTDLVEWHQSSTESCPDCDQHATDSPFQAQDLPSYPGDGHTSCVTNCKCYLVHQVSGRRSFTDVGG